MSIEDRILRTFEDPEQRARILQWAWWISMGFVFFGYGYIAYILFF